MTIKKVFLSCVLILLWLSKILGQQNLSFTSLTTKDGLSSNTINAIEKDIYGLMWFATDDGLNKFDGTNFTVYRHKPNNQATLQVNEILALHEDKAGNLWVGTGGGSLSLYDRKKDAFVNFPADGGSKNIDNGVILSVCSDYLGKIWIGHFGGINILDPQTKAITRLYTAPNVAFTKTSHCVFEDSKRQIWIGTDDGVFLYNPSNKSLTNFRHNPDDLSSVSANEVIAITEDKLQNIWIGTTDGLSKLEPGKKSFINYKHDASKQFSLSNNIVNDLAVDEENKLWIGTGAGLNILDVTTGEIIEVTANPRKVNSLTTNTINSVFIDGKGIYWIGNHSGGINKYDKNLNLFNLVRSNPFDKQGLMTPKVTAFAEAENGEVFIGTDGGGVSLFDPKTSAFQQFGLISKEKNTENRLAVMALKMTRNKQLLVGTFSDGLFVVDPGTGRYQQLMQGANSELNSNAIFCIKEDRQGNRWVGTNGQGINVLNSANKVITRYTPSPRNSTDVKLPINGYIRDIIEDRHGNFWIATHGGGVAYFQSANRSFTVYNTGNSQLPNDQVQTLLEDSQGNIWAGTLGGGLASLNQHTKQFTVLSESEGLLNNNVYKILEDRKGLLWISTNKGLSSYDQKRKKINNYHYHNGVLQNNFVHGSGLRTSRGYLYFGALDGFNFFNPENLKKNNNVPAVLITDLKISNKSVEPSADGPIQENISIAKKIDLDYKQNFALSFVGVSYTAPEQNLYAYRLEGFEKDWNNVGSATTAVYTNLDPGEYTFRVRASNNDGVWNTEGTSIKIYVHPPLWRTNYAYAFYLLVIVGTLFFIRHRGIQKIKRRYILAEEKARAERERKEAERLHELDQLKIKFLTNLSHEFRTPISLILGPVEMLLSEDKNKPASDQLRMIKRNAKRLLNLVNQLLDFRKMEENELRLHLSEGELVSFVKEVFDSFKDLAQRKKIDFVFTSSINLFWTRFDHDKMERILFNILSNAFKFTLEGGKVSLEIENLKEPGDQTKTWIAIKVSDSGIGIPEDEKEKVFKRFFQATTTASILNQGTGLGLSITREFVKMLGGTIELDSTVGKGSMFSVKIPFSPLENVDTGTERLQPEVVSEEKKGAITGVVKQGNVKGRPAMPSILLVEDNEDFRLYLKENLCMQYKVFEAADGKEGWQKTLAEHPDLIVSDISMPVMDGIELCRKIKSDKRTHHIPVILLTALTREEDQIKGLETGANDYITKPFNYEVLNAKVKNLLVLNQSLKNAYTKQIRVLAPEIKVESANEQLLHNIMLFIEENLTETQLSVENLSRHVGMSRSSLYSKLLELTGQTPVEFIRSVKLDKAAVLLEKSDMNISQIAYSVGFPTPNYFAKSFKEKFNMLPSEYVNKMRKESS